MGKAKLLEDKVIFKNIVEAVCRKRGILKRDFYSALGYKSSGTPNMVLNGTNDISYEMESRILDAFPEVSLDYIRKGEGGPLLEGNRATNQNNVMGVDPDLKLADVLSLPAQLAAIDAKLNQILEILTKTKQS